MTWYSFVFPNTALTTATFAVDRALDGNRAIQIIGCALAILVVLTWFFVFGMMIRAVWTHQILWPQRQEDRNEGGWVEGDERLPSVDREKEVMFRRASAMQRRWKDEVKAVERRKTVDWSGVDGDYDFKKAATGDQKPKEHDDIEPEFDRADFAIKEEQRLNGAGPVRGRMGRASVASGGSNA